MKQNKLHLKLVACLFGIFISGKQFAQEVPSVQQNLEMLVTFGSKGDHSAGDDDFSQTVFSSAPMNQANPFYIRIFDPETFGEHDESKSGWDTKMKYSIYGGKDSYYNKDARGVNPVGSYKSGILLASKIFGSEKATDNKWISLGPFNPQQGELVNDLSAFVFKVVIDGLKGNDGNGYKLFLSSKKDENLPLEGANAFVYEYSVRLKSTANTSAHVYPFADSLVTSFKIMTFDFDDDGQIKLYSSVKNGRPVSTSNDKDWSSNAQGIVRDEKNKCLDLELVKKGDSLNDVVIYVTNENDVPLPLFTIPLGGAPKYLYKVKVTQTARDK